MGVIWPVGPPAQRWELEPAEEKVGQVLIRFEGRESESRGWCRAQSLVHAQQHWAVIGNRVKSYRSATVVKTK